MLLAIDTATQAISLALHDGQDVIAEHTWRSPNNHTVELAPAVQMILRRANIALHDLTALAVCIGPGSYSALRIGVAFAKGMADVRHLPLVGATTFEILAAGLAPYANNSADERSTLITTAQAGRGRVIAARHTPHNEAGELVWEAQTAPELFDWESLLNGIDAPTWIGGEVDPRGRDLIEAARANGMPITLIDAAGRLRRAGYLGSIAQKRLTSEGEAAFNAAVVAPVYVKTKDTP